MHKTTAGEKRKALKAEALELARDAKAAMKASKTLQDARKKARTLEGQADSLQAEAEALKGAARLEDLHIWQMDKVKTTNKGSQTYYYWMASWREGDRESPIPKTSARIALAASSSIAFRSCTAVFCGLISRSRTPAMMALFYVQN